MTSALLITALFLVAGVLALRSGHVAVSASQGEVRVTLRLAPPGRERRDPRSLEIRTLGPLVARRNGQEVRAWGGPKAGSRQALAVFAFLLDRAERGVQKDEFLELIWPDVDLQVADQALHRTLNGLRTTLNAPAPGPRNEVIGVRNGVYRLNGRLIAWLDIEELERHLAALESHAELSAMERHLDAVRRLYRGDYMDDCPFFGDSSQVEDRRQLIRARYVDALRTVAQARQAAGMDAGARELFREAMILSGGIVTDDIPGPQLVYPAA